MRTLGPVVLLAAACGDPTGIGELALREDARYDLVYAAAVHYDCADYQSGNDGIPILFPPADPEICGDATDTVLTRHDTVTASVRVIGPAESIVSFYPAGAHFEVEAEGRYGTCSLRPASGCGAQDFNGRGLLTRGVLSCEPGFGSGSEPYVFSVSGLFDVGQLCATTGADSVALVWILVSGGPDGSFFGLGVETDARVEGLEGAWMGALPARTGEGERRAATAFDLREVRAESWTLERR